MEGATECSRIMVLQTYTKQEQSHRLATNEISISEHLLATIITDISSHEE
jgi:NAD kinase